MRDTYGKMVYLLQDSASPEVRELLDFSLVRRGHPRPPSFRGVPAPLRPPPTLWPTSPLRSSAPFLSSSSPACMQVADVQTVHQLLANSGPAALALLDEPTLAIATMEIKPAGKTRLAVQREIKAKEGARAALARKYAAHVSEEDLLQCMYSIGDNSSFLAATRDPIDVMLHYQAHYFRPTTYEAGLSLSISTGSEGARLSHSHERQYTYVRQTLTLWREIMHDMFKLWLLAEKDLLRGSNAYRLVDTGQVSKYAWGVAGAPPRARGRWTTRSACPLPDAAPDPAVFVRADGQHRSALPPFNNTCVLRLRRNTAELDQKGLLLGIVTIFSG